MELRNERVARRAVHIGAAAMAMTLLAVGVLGYCALAPQTGRAAGDEAKAKPAEKDGASPQRPPVELGLLINEPKAFRGYTLLNPMNTKTTYLIDIDGRVVKSWESKHNSMHAAYLLENGHLFRVAVLAGGERSFGGGPGAAGRLQEFGWDGDLVWDFEFHTFKQYPHHDAAKMPNGNVLMVVWDKKMHDEAIAAGRKPELVSDYLLPDSIVEVKPTGKTTGEVVWEWHLWDHVVQDHDSTKDNYGDVAKHPELVDINFAESSMGPPPGPPGQGPDTKKAGPPRDPAKDAVKKAEAEKLKTIGYVGTPQQRSQRVNPDWTHVNSVDYNAELDQIVISVHEFSEIWVIDHSTTTAEAAGHKGGRSGKGGDLLYRWGNPRAYRAGTKADQTLFAQHNAQWIPGGLPGEGHLLVFNNGGNRPGGSYTSVDELVLPVDSQGRYTRETGASYGPKKPVWSYSSPQKSDFYAFFISGAQRLPNGNTLICSGPNGTLFEVTPGKETVWKYVNPVKGGFPPPGFGPGSPPRPNQVLPGFLQDMLGLSDERKKEIDALQRTVDDKLAKVLTDAQKKTLSERSAPGPGGFAGMPLPGQVMSVATQVALKPTPEQKTQLVDLQKEVDARLDKVLTDDQKKQLKQMREDFTHGGPPGFVFAGPPGGGPGRPGGGPPGGPPGGFPGGPPGGSGVFRAYRYGPAYPGLAGKDLKPGKTVQELQPKEPEKSKGTFKAKETASR
jgi:Arylsulfotransferase (ASST)